MSRTIYELGEVSAAKPGVPTGSTIRYQYQSKHLYPGVSYDYWVYVPAQYRDREPACAMFFQDGEAYVHEEGQVRASLVFDNLIHAQEMPVCIGIFVNPGTKNEPYDQRNNQYTPLDNTYARFLLEEVQPEVSRHVNMTDDRSGRAICGMSDGGLCSFTAGWHRTDAFSKVISHIGSFTRLRGGSEYPYLIRRTRGAPKPLRVFLQDGSADINLVEGSWPQANLNMASALMFSRYDYRFAFGEGGHDLMHGGSIFPDTLRWLWRDFPGVSSQGNAFSTTRLEGYWQMTTYVLGEVRQSILSVSLNGGSLAATFEDEVDGEIKLESFDFDGGILTFEYMTPPSQTNWGKGFQGLMKVWTQVLGDTLNGALSGDPDLPMDFAVKGRRRSRTD